MSPSPSAARPAHKYILHLDGLRALALFGVLLYHFEVPPFTGGFAGVDVFLTLSGFLITRNIILDHHERAFSLRAFYIRRFFRLYPAATVTTFFTVLGAALLFPDVQARNVSASGLASMFLSSNVYFYSQSDYFEDSAVLKPLLHTWSLSLEEQFYLLWAPIIAVLLWKAATLRTFYAVLATLIFSSFVIGASSSVFYPSFAFFLLPTRLFQFGLGALLAVSCTSHVFKADASYDEKADSLRAAMGALQCTIGSRKLAEAASLGALVTIIATYVFLPEGAPPHLMVPTALATTALIALPDTTVSKRLLSNAALRCVGRYSYAAYLVHWPVYVYLRFFVTSRKLGNSGPFAPAVGTLLLAAALKHAVEDVMRSQKSGRTLVKRSAFGVFALSTAALCVLGILTGGFSFRGLIETPKEEAIRVLAYSGLPWKYGADMCNLRFKKGRKTGHLYHDVCELGVRTDIENTSQQADFYFYGNSYNRQMTPAVYALAMRRGLYIRSWVGWGCLYHPPNMVRRVFADCQKSNRDMHRDMRSLPPNSTVVISTRWGWKSERDMRDRLRGYEQYVMHKLHHKLVIITEPPGLAKRYTKYFSCIQVRQESARMNVSHAEHCGLNVSHGMEPLGSMRWKTEMSAPRSLSAKWYRRVQKEVNASIVNLFDEVCHRTEQGGGKRAQHLCHLPLGRGGVVGDEVLRDPGYQPDRNHISLYGAYSLVDVFDRALMGGEAARYREER